MPFQYLTVMFFPVSLIKSSLPDSLLYLGKWNTCLKLKNCLDQRETHCQSVSKMWRITISSFPQPSLRNIIGEFFPELYTKSYQNIKCCTSGKSWKCKNGRISIDFIALHSRLQKFRVIWNIPKCFEIHIHYQILMGYNLI